MALHASFPPLPLRKVGLTSLTSLTSLAAAGRWALLDTKGVPPVQVTLYKNNLAYFERQAPVLDGAVPPLLPGCSPGVYVMV
jgi:hypothetical protein